VSTASLPGFVRGTPAAVQRWTPAAPLTLQCGALLPAATIGYQTWGRLNVARDNVIWICHALSGSSDVASWWPQLVGAGRGIDPARHFIVCANVLGGCYGSLGPQSTAPDGARWGTRFPQVHIADMVEQQRLLADQLGVLGIECVIGGSMGGFQALEWAAREPERVKSVALIASSWRQPPQAIALADLQCRLLRADPKFRGGEYPLHDPPIEGLSLARQLGHISYRTPDELDQRFGRQRRDDGTFQVLSYLHRQGEKLVERFDALSYLALSEALNNYDFCEGRGELRVAARRIRQPVLIAGILTDQLYPPGESAKLAAALPDGRLEWIDAPAGHDGFLLEGELFGQLLRKHVLREVGGAVAVG
jgi:homoserine O-acetyltransferase